MEGAWFQMQFWRAEKRESIVLCIKVSCTAALPGPGQSMWPGRLSASSWIAGEGKCGRGGFLNGIFQNQIIWTVGCGQRTDGYGTCVSGMPFRCMGSSGWCKLPSIRKNGSTRKKVLQMQRKEKSATKFITMSQAESYLGLCLNCRNQTYTKGWVRWGE